MGAELAGEIERRRALLGEELTRQGIDAAVVASEGNFLYLSGYGTNAWSNTARPMCLVFRPGVAAVVVLSEGEAERLTREGIDVDARPYREPHVTRSDGDVALEFMPAVADRVVAELERLGAGKVGLELSSHFLPRLSPLALGAIRERLGPDRTVDLSPALWRLRRRKSPFEVARVRRAAQTLGAAFERFEERAMTGMTERELHRLFSAEAPAAGVDRVGYTVVLAGVEEAPLGGPSDRRWEPGQLLLFDAGIVVDGYWADFGRIYAAGPLTREQLAAYEAVVAALAAGREAARAGIRAQALAAALAPADAGGGEPFGRVGHGVGLDLTEPPSLHRDDPTLLEAGMTLCLEPNRHVPGVGYLVGEEEIVITEDGAELLSPLFPAEPRILG